MELIVTRRSGEQFTVLYDEVDADLVASRKWCVGHRRQTLYAKSCIGYLHRLILPGVAMVDHVNGNGLDNRRQNLRPCTPLQNAGNMRTARGSSRYKGVRRDKWTGRWEAAIHHDRKRCWLGRFDSEEEAALAYDRAAQIKWGEFAYLNFPLETGASA